MAAQMVALQGALAARPVARSQKAPSSRPFLARQQQRAVACRRRVILAADATKAGAGAVNDTTWEELVLKSPLPVLVDFWAPWCGPCRMIAPLIDELSAEYDGRLRTLKVNTDESPNVATEYGIRSIPTVMVFKGGKKMDAVIGAVPKSTLVQTIEKYLD